MNRQKRARRDCWNWDCKTTLVIISVIKKQVFFSCLLLLLDFMDEQHFAIFGVIISFIYQTSFQPFYLDFTGGNWFYYQHHHYTTFLHGFIFSFYHQPILFLRIQVPGGTKSFLQSFFKLQDRRCTGMSSIIITLHKDARFFTSSSASSALLVGNNQTKPKWQEIVLYWKALAFSWDSVSRALSVISSP